MLFRKLKLLRLGVVVAIITLVKLVIHSLPMLAKLVSRSEGVVWILLVVVRVLLWHGRLTEELVSDKALASRLVLIHVEQVFAAIGLGSNRRDLFDVLNFDRLGVRILFSGSFLIILWQRLDRHLTVRLLVHLHAWMHAVRRWVLRISNPRVGSSTVWIIDRIGAIRYHRWLLTVHAAIHWRHHWVAVRVVRVRRHLAAVHLWVARWVTIWLLGKMERLLATHLGGADGALSALAVIDLRVLLAIVANGAQLSALVLF